MVGWDIEDDLLLFVAAVAEDSLAAAAPPPPPAPGANNIPNGALYGCWVRSIVTIPSPPLRNDEADNILKNFGSDEWVAPRTHGTSRFADVATALDAPQEKRGAQEAIGASPLSTSGGGIVGGIV
jgi:hypothetical protein